MYGSTTTNVLGSATRALAMNPPPYKKTALDLELERLRDALRYVLEDEPSGLPRASSSCREHIKSVLEE